MKKRNLVLQAAIAGLFTVASLSAVASGSTSNAIGNSAQIATQAITTPSSSVIGSGSLTYTVSGSIPVGSYYIYVQLGNGATFADATGSTNGGAFTGAGSIVGGALIAGNIGGATVAVGAGTVLTNAPSIVAFPVTVTVAAMPANGTFTFKPTGVAATNGAITGVGAAIAAGQLGATMSMGSAATYFTTLSAIQTDEAAASGALIDTFTSGINAATLQSGAFGATTAPSAAFTGGVAETDQINVLNNVGATALIITGAASNTTVASELLNLGGFYFADVSTNTTATSNPLNSAATATFNLVTNYPVAATTKLSAVVTGPAGFFNVAAGATSGVTLTTAPNCTGAVGGTATLSVGNSTATFAAFAIPATGVASTAADVTAGITAATTSSILGPYYVCVGSLAPHATQWVPGQPSLTSATLVAANVGSVSTSGLLYNLLPNGGSAYVREYIPASVSPAYTSFIRVINTGNVSANISAAVVSDVTGLSGFTGTIATAVPAGGAVTVTSSQIETAIKAAGGVAPGGQSATDPTGFRPRLFITAPTTIAVQSFILQSNGTFSEVSGGNVGNIIGPVNVVGGNSVNGNINPYNQ